MILTQFMHFQVDNFDHQTA